jgi:hypothetical protein
MMISISGAVIVQLVASAGIEQLPCGHVPYLGYLSERVMILVANCDIFAVASGKLWAHRIAVQGACAPCKGCSLG